MSSRGRGTDEDGKLRRLPPGRHGLSREFVTRNQRERLIAGTIAAVAEHGFRDTSVTQIAAAAGVSRRTFYGYFGSKEECFSATYDLLEEHLLRALQESDAGARSWSAKVRTRVRTLLEFLAANPDLIRFSVLAPPSAGGAIAERGRTFLHELVAQLTEDHPAVGGRSERTAVELEATAGSISAVLTSAVRPEGTEALEGAAPQLVELVLAPFIGHKRAAVEAEKV